LSQSFEKLQNRILSDAKLKAGELIREAEAKAKQMEEEAKAEAKKEAETFLAKARLEAEALRRRILSSKVRANRLRLLEEKNRIVRSILSGVEERLSVISDTPGFMDMVKKMVNEAVEAVGADQAVVRVGFNQASSKGLDSLSKDLPRGAKLVVEEGALDQLGGVVASGASNRVTYNNSFRARMDRLGTQLLTVISSIVFGE